MTHIELTVNGEKRSDEVEPRLLLIHYLREELGLRAANVGCVQANGHEVTTAEGLSEGGELHPVQAAFQQEHGLQCGFCTPGMVMATVGLLSENPYPTEQQVREGLEGNFCRCTGYHNIIRAVLAAADAQAQLRKSREVTA
jgi:carbon-monoxide dehydrogenase small subunit